MTPTTKRCTRCGTDYPATFEFFHKCSKSPDGFTYQCKRCTAAYAQKRRAEHRDEINARNLEGYYRNREQWSETHRDWLARNAEHVKQYKREYNERNQEQIRESEKRYRDANRDKRIKGLARWRDRNKQYVSDYNREYSQSARGKATVHRRLARKHELPDTLTSDDWSRCLDYWHGVCAYCGAQQDFWHVIEADHYVPLSSSDCPGTIPENMLPACKACNTSKGHRPPEQWMVDKFGKRKAAQIAARILAYFDWIRQRNRLDVE